MSEPTSRGKARRVLIALEAWWNEKHLQALLAFANADLGTIRQGDVERLRSQLSTVASAGQSAGYSTRLLRKVGVIRKDLAPAVRQEERLALHRRLRWLLSRIVLDHSAEAPPISLACKRWGLGTWTVPAKIQRVVLTWPLRGSTPGGLPDVVLPALRGSIHHVYSAPWPDIFWLGVMSILEKSGSRIRRCGHCRTLFAFRTRRQEYCKDTCSLRGRQRKWTKAHPKDASDLRHNAYVAWRRKKAGNPNLQVQRRPHGPVRNVQRIVQ